MFNFPSDCCSKPYPIIAAVKLCVVAGNEVGSQNPDGTCRWRHIQAPKGDGADIPFDLWLLEPQIILIIIIRDFNSNIFTVVEEAQRSFNKSRNTMKCFQMNVLKVSNVKVFVMYKVPSVST